MRSTYSGPACRTDFDYSKGIASKFLTAEPSPRAVTIMLRVGAAGLTL